MPPKDKRQSIAPWLKCEKCSCIISSKDLVQHPQACPPSVDHFIHPLIKYKTIFSVIEEQKPNSTTLKHVPLSQHATLVQMSQQAMQLCHLCIGDPVSMEVNGTRVVRCVWPTPEGSLMSVVLTKSGIELLGCKAGDLVRVQNLNSPPVPAGEVFIQLQGPQSILTEEQVVTLLQRQQQDRVFFENNLIGLRYMGTTLKYKVVKVVPVGGAFDTLEEDLKNMTITSGQVQAQCFRVVPDTVFQFNKSSSECEGSVPELSQVGGLDNIIEELEEIITNVTSSKNIFPGLSPMRGVLLHGAPGTGKSMLATALGHSTKLSFITIPAAEIFSKFYGETESKLKSLFSDAVKRSPSLVFIDEVDVICPKRNSSSSQQEQRVLAALVSELDALDDQKVVVLAATNRPDSIDPSLRRPGRLDREIELPVPNPPARRQMLKKMLKRIEHKLNNEQIEDTADRAHGYVGADLMALCRQASSKAAKRGAESVEADDLDWALSQVKPSAMREVLVEVPNVQWADIGGQKDLILKLKQAIEWPLKHPEAFVRLGIKAPRGVLMYGPPGCSKTMIAKALATESDLNFLSIKGPELFSKWVGESEKAVRTLFRRARQVAPAIVFFDELDALCGKRGDSGSEGGSNVQERVLAQLLTELDGVEPLTNVTVVAATNRPDRIDKALLRPGRLDRIIYVPLPDADTRREIFTIQMRKTPFDQEVVVDSLVEKTDGYSGAEVSAVCHEAALAALQEDITAEKVHWRHCIQALTSVTPRTPASLLEMYSQYQYS